MSMDRCLCGGRVEKLLVPVSAESEDRVETGESLCAMCGGIYTKSGKFLPPHSGWALPYVPVQVICFANGAVMVFDNTGQQVSHLQFILGRESDREQELARIFDRSRWEWRFWQGNKEGIAVEPWLQGRAAWINRHFGLPEDSPDGRAVADLENEQAELLIGRQYVGRSDAHRYGLPGDGENLPDGTGGRAAGEDSQGEARGPV